MGRLIDETDLMNLLYVLDDARHELFYAIKKIPELPTVEAIPKSQYETRLKTDMATIKQLSNSLKVLRKANSGIEGAYDKLKSDYETRLKADLKAILVELQLQIEEYEPKWVENDEQAVASCRTREDLDGIIQNKINTLRAEQEED